MVSEKILDVLAKQLVRANELIKEQEDNIAFLDEIQEDTSELTASLNSAIEKRDLIQAAVMKRVPDSKKK